MRKVKISDIASKAGVSISAVSFVLNGKEKEMRISKSVARKIRQVAKKEGYHPNRAAVSLRTGESKIIGLIVDTISGSFFSRLANVIETEAGKYGYKVIYGSTANGSEGSEQLLRILSQHNVDGYLVMPEARIESQIASLIKRKNPVVLIDSYFAKLGVPYVMVDNFQGVADGVSWLYEKGYRRIGFVGSDLDMVQMKDRVRGYSDTVKAKKLKIPKGLICETVYGMENTMLIRKIADYVKKMRPDALMFGANYLGVAGLEALTGLGMSVPADMGMVCFDDMDIFRLYPPGITAVEQPIHEIGHKAVEILMGEMGVIPVSVKKSIMIKGHLVERNSFRVG
ncbi:MAG: LacI family DNA-binding transcriptional regulator [Gemmatimonadaceae bacterium]|nr:LacI family DNA-binding transcriptional regulator [Chitinophagaceae bacterium]